jgi:hypothetical protein
MNKLKGFPNSPQQPNALSFAWLADGSNAPIWPSAIESERANERKDAGLQGKTVNFGTELATRGA